MCAIPAVFITVTASSGIKKAHMAVNGIIDLFPSSSYSTGVLLSYIFYYIHAFVCLWPRADLMISQMHHFIIYNQPSRAQVL